MSAEPTQTQGDVRNLILQTILNLSQQGSLMPQLAGWAHRQVQIPGHAPVNVFVPDHAVADPAPGRDSTATGDSNDAAHHRDDDDTMHHHHHDHLHRVRMEHTHVHRFPEGIPVCVVVGDAAMYDATTNRFRCPDSGEGRRTESGDNGWGEGDSRWDEGGLTPGLPDGGSGAMRAGHGNGCHACGQWQEPPPVPVPTDESRGAATPSPPSAAVSPPCGQHASAFRQLG